MDVDHIIVPAARMVFVANLLTKLVIGFRVASFNGMIAHPVVLAVIPLPIFRILGLHHSKAPKDMV